MAILTRHWKLAILWALSLVAVGLMSSSPQAQRGQPRFDLLTESPAVLSGSDIGFRLERTQDGIAVGRIVIRVDGRWVDTAPPR
jgi:hypothetical protein